MYGYIYKTTNLINNKIYIGQYKSTKFDTSYYGSGKYLKNAIKKYGIENFKVEIIYKCKSKAELVLYEIEYISLYKKISNCYNITNGGYGLRDYKFTEADKQKIGNATRIHNLNRDKEIYEKVSKHHKGSKLINNGVEQKWCYKDELDNYLNNGWKIGNCKRRNRDYSGKNNNMYGKSAVKGRKWVHKYENNSLIRLYVFKEDLEKYLLNGFKLGMK